MRRGARLRALAATTVLMSMVTAILGMTSSAVAGSPVVSVFPISGSQVAPPHAQISFRGVSAAGLGPFTVTGSRSGGHTGSVKPHSDGRGASFVPHTAFTPGEVVTVATHLRVVGASTGVYRFAVATPAGRLPFRPFAPSRRSAGDVLQFHSRPDLSPAAVRVTKREKHIALGYIFLGPEYGPLQGGPLVLDSGGGLIWFKPLPKYVMATDVRVQSYQGRPVMTWWQGYFGAGVGNGEDVINDVAYHVIAVVKAGNGLSADLHQFQLTPRGTALVSAVFPVRWNASSIHRSKNAVVFDNVVQEIDVKTGLVLFQWDSLDHIPLNQSYTRFPPRSGAPFDYFHLNSIDPDRDGNIVISGRSTSAAYKIDHSTGKVLWTLGGKHSSFKLDSDAQMAFQHDVRVRANRDGVLTAFDNGAGLYNVHSQSRAVTLRLDFKHNTVSRISEFDHSPGLLATYEGNAQQLPGGDTFVGWGEQPYLSEFNSRGQMLFDAHFGGVNASYSAYRYRWVGLPETLPAVAASSGGGHTTIYVSWNGATQVSRWRTLAGSNPTALKVVSTAQRSGFETQVSIGAAPYVAVQGLDGAGHVLGQSSTVRPH